LKFIPEEGSDSKNRCLFLWMLNAITGELGLCGYRASGIRKVNFIAAGIEESFKEHTCI